MTDKFYMAHGNTQDRKDLRTATLIALRAFGRDLDRSGLPKVGHSIRVSSFGLNADERVVGMLHDLIEDTTVTLEDLRAAGFSKVVVGAVALLTKREGLRYRVYADRLVAAKGAAGRLARRVKLNDLMDNMTRTGAAGIGSSLARQRYLPLMARL